MTQTLNPVITVTVSGPVGSGKSYRTGANRGKRQRSTVLTLIYW
ncbi:hypothetical protein P423_04930 [Escherichia coli JJ1886]|nr:hypothetical protein P423_04930 [Escherichia coli JJ1886]